jgi:hypothetical protein
MLIAGLLIGLVGVLLLLRARRSRSARNSTATHGTPDVSLLPSLLLDNYRRRQDPSDRGGESGF